MLQLVSQSWSTQLVIAYIENQSEQQAYNLAIIFLSGHLDELNFVWELSAVAFIFLKIMNLFFWC